VLGLLKSGRIAAVAIPLTVLLLAGGAATSAQAAPAAPAANGVTVSPAVKHDVSPPLTAIDETGDHQQYDQPRRKTGEHRQTGRDATTPGAPGTGSAAPTAPTSTSFDAIGNGVAGFTVGSAPPDPNGAVGPNHYVETVNTSFAVYSKTGSLLYGPRAINTIWSGFGGLCQTDNDGDPSVLYDQLANRWLIAQFAITGASAGSYLLCVAVSTGPDPAGSYYRYAFTYTNFPDYPKFAVWPDGYYVTTNQFDSSGTTFYGPSVAALDRTRMINGQAANQQAFTGSISSIYGGLLPSSLDGPTAPPAGAPNYIVGLGADTSSLAAWTMHVDWSNSNNTTLSAASALSVPTYTLPCSGGGTCIPQAGTSNKLDSLGDRLMYRLAYRNFGDHESLVVDHSVALGSTVGMRWYELRISGGAPLLFQSGTYSPDSTYRWMGSIAMDHVGDMAMGYSASSSSLRPGIRYTGRLAGDPAGTMTQGEGTILTGGGSQTGTLSRWGDYTSMAVDPADDCTFWYTNEYIPSDGTFNWRTRVGYFKFPSCSTGPDYSLSANPSTISATPGGGGTSTITVNALSGYSGNVSLSASGAPTGSTASMNPTSVAAGSSSTLTVNVGTTTSPGSYTITVTGNDGASPPRTRTTTVTLNVSKPAGQIDNGGFETGNLSGWTPSSANPPVVLSGGAHTGTYSARIGSTSPAAADSTLSQVLNVSPAGGSLSFWYNPHCPDTITYDWQQFDILDSSGAVLATPLKVCDNAATWKQLTVDMTPYKGTQVTLRFLDHDDNYAGDPTYFQVDDVTFTPAGPPPAPDFSLSANPTTVVAPLASTDRTTSITVTPANGFNSAVSGFSVSGLPTGSSYSFNPTTVNGSGSTTLTFTQVPANATVQDYALTVTATSGALSHTTPVTLRVTDFSVSANPTSLSVVQGSSGTSTISVTAQNGFNDSVALTTTGTLPAGTTATFNPTSATPTTSSTLTLATTSSTPVGGPYSITVQGADGSLTRTTTVNLTVTAPPPPDFSLSANPTTVVAQLGSQDRNTSITVMPSNGFNGTVSFGVTGLPSGGSYTFSPNTVTGSGSTTLTFTVPANATVQDYALTVTGTSGSLNHTTSVTLRVTNFSVSASPTSLSVVQGSSASSTVSVAAQNGFNGTVNLTSGVSPAATGLTATYNPTSVTSSGNSTLTLATTSATTPGAYTVTVTGASTSGAGPNASTLTRNAPTSITLTVNPAPQGITNGGFETGNLSGWTPSSGNAPVVVSSAKHTGTYSARVGSTSPTATDSTLRQTFSVPTGGGTLSFWYQPHCTDTIRYDWQEFDILNTSGTVLATPLKVCANSSTWTQVSVNLAPYAGTQIQIRFLDHDDNWPGDPTYFLIDDVTYTAPAAPTTRKSTGGESGSRLAGWTSAWWRQAR
jgi:uncharacterized membrane protein